MLETIIDRIPDPSKRLHLPELNMTSVQKRAYWSGIKVGYALSKEELESIDRFSYNDWMAAHHLGQLSIRLTVSKESLEKKIDNLADQEAVKKVDLARIVKLNKVFYIVNQSMEHALARLPVKAKNSPCNLIRMNVPTRNGIHVDFINGEHRSFEYMKLNFLHESIICNQKLIEQALSWGVSEWSKGLAQTDDDYQNKIDRKTQTRANRILEHYLPVLSDRHFDVQAMLDCMQLNEIKGA